MSSVRSASLTSLRLSAAFPSTRTRAALLRPSASTLRAFSASSLSKGGPGDEKPYDANPYRGGGEEAMPGAGSVDQIADSEAAYDSSKPRPDQSASKIEQEKPETDMSKTAASSEPSHLASAKGRSNPSGESKSSG